MKVPPTAFIRTLPPFYADGAHKAGRAHRRALKRLESDDSAYLYIALSQQPRQEVLHVYLCIAGKINVRLNLAGYEAGDKRECFDGSMRQPATWAICTGPVSRPPEPIIRRGFQGIRYTEDLW